MYLSSSANSCPPFESGTQEFRGLDGFPSVQRHSKRLKLAFLGETHILFCNLFRSICIHICIVIPSHYSGANTDQGGLNRARCSEIPGVRHLSKEHMILPEHWRQQHFLNC